MGSAVSVIALVSLFGLIVLRASARGRSGLGGGLARARGYKGTNAEATLSRAIADPQPRHTSAFQLRVQVAQNPFKSTPPR